MSSRAGELEWRVGELSAPAAALAAVAESGVMFLALRLVATEIDGATVGPFATYPAFVALAVGATFLATRLHRFGSMPLAVAAVFASAGFVQARVLGISGGVAIAVSVIAGLLVSLRVITLALRDWRNPIGASFAGSAALLLIEALTARNVHAGWEVVLPVILPVFFAASLASRAVSVRLSGLAAGKMVPRPDLEPEAGQAVPAVPPPRVSMLVLGALAAAVVVAGVGLRAGLFEAVGRVARPVVVAAVTVVAVVAGAMAAVVGWIGDRLHIDFRKGVDKVRRALAQHHRRTGASHHYWNLLWLDRLLGLLLVAFTVWVLVRMIRRFRERPAWRRRWLMGRTAVREAGPPEPEPAGGRRWRRRVLPGDAARRWYAEALLLLETRGVDRAGATTPREYRVEVAEAIPASAHGFGVLTQAYEEVRYGGVTFDRSRLRALRRDRDAAMDAIRRARRVGPPPEPRTPATEEPRWTADRPEGEDGAGPRAPGRPDGGSGR